MKKEGNCLQNIQAKKKQKHLGQWYSASELPEGLLTHPPPPPLPHSFQFPSPKQVRETRSEMILKLLKRGSHFENHCLGNQPINQLLENHNAQGSIYRESTSCRILQHLLDKPHWSLLQTLKIANIGHTCKGTIHRHVPKTARSHYCGEIQDVSFLQCVSL